MTTLQTSTPTEVVPPPMSEPAKANGACHVDPAVLAAPTAPQIEKRLNAIRDLGNDIRKLERRRDKEETVVAEAESGLKSSRAVLNKTIHEIEELHDELTTLATGKQSERLPFGQAKALAKSEAPKPLDPSEQALQQSFDALSLADIGVKPAGLIGKLETDGIRNGGELRKWIQDTFRRDIKGVGKQSVEKLSNIMTDKMMQMHNEAKAAKSDRPPELDARPEPDSVPLNQAMGNAKKPRGRAKTKSAEMKKLRKGR